MITDVAFALVGWLNVAEDGTMTISDQYIEMEMQMGGPGGPGGPGGMPPDGMPGGPGGMPPDGMPGGPGGAPPQP